MPRTRQQDFSKGEGNTITMPSKGRPPSWPFAALLVLGLVVLVGWLFLNGTPAPEEDTPETTAELPRQPERGPLIPEMRMGMDRSPAAQAYREELRQQREAEAPPPEPEEEPEEGEYPPTEEYTPPEPIEIALEMEPGELIGWVNDEHGAPLQDVRIALKYEEAVEDGVEPPTPETRSTENGLFTVEEIPPGPWTVTARKDNYAKVAQTAVQIPSGSQAGPITLRMEPELVLKGTVRARDEVLPGAQVSVFRDLLTINSRGEVSRVRVDYGGTSTDGEGAFEIRRLPEAALTLRVRSPGYARLQERIPMRPDMSALQLTLRPEATLGGTVRGSLGQAVEGAELTLRQPDVGGESGEVAKTTSGENGTFLFRELPSGRDYHLHAKAENYAPAGPIEVSSGTSTNVINLDSGGIITGRVANFDTGAPMASIGVVAISANEDRRRTALWTKTNSRGEYRITRLPAGDYNVAIVNDSLTSEPKSGVQVDHNSTTEGIDFSIYPGLQLRGYVVDGETGDPLQDARVTVKSLVGPELLTAKETTTFTEGSGIFRFPNMPQGLYTFEASLDGYMRGAGEEGSVRVEALRGTDPEPVDIKLYRGGRIEGYVNSAGGNPIPNATVQLFRAGGSPGRIRERDFFTSTDSGGHFEMEGIPIHDEVHLHVTAWAEGHTKARSERVILNRDQSSRTVELVLGAGQTLQATVRSSTGEGLSDADVRLSHSDFSDPDPSTWRQRESEDGRYSFENIPFGRVRVNASRDGYLPAGGNVNVESRGIAEIELTLDPAQRITGRVYDDQLNTLRSGRVDARAERGARGSGRSNIDSEGRFDIDTIGEGTFLLEVNTDISTSTGNRRFTWGFPGNEPNMGLSDVILVVPAGGGLEGKVFLPDSEGPPARFSIRVRGSYTDDAGRNRSINESHNFSGTDRWRFEKLPPGEYNVTASAPNYLPVTVGPFEVGSDGVYTAGTISLHPGGAVRFRAVHSRTQEAIGGVLGRLTPDGPSSRTNNQGIANIGTVKPDIYTLELSHGDFLPTEREVVQVTRGGETDLGTIRMDPGGVLHGRVVDGTRQPLRGINVEARSVEEEDEVNRAGTDAGGRYSLRGLRPGGQIVTFSGTVNDRRVARSFEINISPERESNHDVTLWANSRLTGTLNAASDVDVSRAVVNLYPMRGDNVPITGQSIRVSGISGNRFVEDNMLEGRYLVTVQAPRGSGTAYWANVVTVEDRETYATINQGTTNIDGRILMTENGPPVANQEVQLRLLTAPQSGVSSLRQWWQWTTRTGEDGLFSLRNLPAGTYSLTAHNDDIEADILEIIQLRPGSYVEGKVLSFQ